MILFKDGAEIRLTREDIIILLEQALNQNIANLTASHRYIKKLTLHPDNKYKARLTISTTKEES